MSTQRKCNLQKKFGALISILVSGIFKKISLGIDKGFQDLVALSVEELGFPQGASLEDIFNTAKNKGFLCSCSSKEAVDYILKHSNGRKKHGTRLAFILEPYTDTESNKKFLCGVLCSDKGGLSIDKYDSGPNNLRTADSHFLFERSFAASTQ